MSGRANHENFEKGKQYEFVEAGEVNAYMWEERAGPFQGGLVTSSIRVPAGTRFEVMDPYWMPPGSDCVPEVQVSADIPTPSSGVLGQPIRDMKLSVGRGMLDVGAVRALSTR